MPRPTRCRRVAWLVSFGATTILASETVHAGPITLNTALPVAANQVFGKQVAIHEHFSREAPDLEQDMDRLTLSSILAYGVTPRLATFLVIPYHDTGLRSAGPGANFERNASGLGDITIFGRYTLYRHDAPGETFRLAPFLGLELPTGRNRLRDAMGRLPPALQTGSGSWDPLGGIVATYQTLGFQIDMQVSYKLTTRADGFDGGGVFRADASFQYRMWPQELRGTDSAFLYGVAEVGYRRISRARLDGQPLTSRASETVTLTLGLQYVAIRWLAEIAIRLPLAHAMAPGMLRPAYGVQAGFRFNF